MNGSPLSFMDQAFFSASAQQSHPFRFRPAAAAVSARGAGTTSALDQMNEYFLRQQMPAASSRYWSMAQGDTPQEVQQDKEGMQPMRHSHSRRKNTARPTPSSPRAGTAKAAIR